MLVTTVRDMFVTTVTQWQAAQFEDVEVAITLLYILAEALPVSVGVKVGVGVKVRGRVRVRVDVGGWYWDCYSCANNGNSVCVAVTELPWSVFQQRSSQGVAGATTHGAGQYCY